MILSSSLTPYTETLVAWLNSSRLVFLFNSESELSKCYIAINEKKKTKKTKNKTTTKTPLCAASEWEFDNLTFLSEVSLCCVCDDVSVDSSWSIMFGPKREVCL